MEVKVGRGGGGGEQRGAKAAPARAAAAAAVAAVVVGGRSSRRAPVWIGAEHVRFRLGSQHSSDIFVLVGLPMADHALCRHWISEPEPGGDYRPKIRRSTMRQPLRDAALHVWTWCSGPYVEAYHLFHLYGYMAAVAWGGLTEYWEGQ